MKPKKTVILTCYDAPTAEILERMGVDMLLVGDSVGMVLLGYPTTEPVTMDEMIHHAKAVRRGAPKAHVIGDLPLRGVNHGVKHAVESAKRFLKEARCNSVKMEWREDAPEIARAFRKNKIPLMGHVGLTPQTLGTAKFGVRGATAEGAKEVLRQALAFQENGAYAVLLECVPAKVSRVISETLKIPTIGIGSGPDCAGQVLVFHDIVGIFRKFKPRFAKRYAKLGVQMDRAVEKFSSEVREGKFPSRKYEFKIDPVEFKNFQRDLP